MSHYMGSKARHAAEITSITLAGRKPGQAYVEPFVGGGNVIVRVPQEQGRRIANDLNIDMVSLLDGMGNKGWEPPLLMPHKEWKRLMKWKADSATTWEDRALYAMAATGPTFGSVWCGTWVKDDGQRWRQARANIMNDAPRLKGVEFHWGQYDGFEIPPESLVYCDPPYFGTAGYDGAMVSIAPGEASSKNTWSAKKFWKWADSLVDSGHTVYVSEYLGPSPTSYDPDPFPASLTSDLKNLAAIAKQKQQDRECPGDEVAAAIDLWRSLDEKRRAYGIAAKVARWKLVWEKEVAVNISAHTVDTDKDQSAERKVERLFSRTA